MFAETARYVGRNARVQTAVAGPDDVDEPLCRGIGGIGVTQSMVPGEMTKINDSTLEIKTFTRGLQSKRVIFTCPLHGPL
jgi:hypothetical protein